LTRKTSNNKQTKKAQALLPENMRYQATKTLPGKHDVKTKAKGVAVKSFYEDLATMKRAISHTYHSVI
jgi:hypothetical protein